MSYEFSVLGFFNWDTDFTDLQRSIFNPENLRSSASCLSYLFVLFVFFVVPSFRFSVLGLFMVKLFVQVFDKSSDFRACQSGLFIKFIKFYLVAIALIQRDVQLALHFASGALGIL